MFRKIDYSLSCAAWALVMPYSLSRSLLRLSVFVFLSLCFLPPLSPPCHPSRFSSFLIPRTLYLLVVIAQGDLENKPTVGDGERLMDIALCSVMMRSPADISRMRRRRYYAWRVIETCIRTRKLSPFIFINLFK